MGPKQRLWSGIKNVNATNYASFLGNYFERGLNGNNDNARITTEILVTNSNYLRSNNNCHLMNIDFAPVNNKSDKVLLHHLSASTTNFTKLIGKLSLAVRTNRIYKNRLEFFLPLKTYNKIYKPLRKNLVLLIVIIFQTTGVV